MPDGDALRVNLGGGWSLLGAGIRRERGGDLMADLALQNGSIHYADRAALNQATARQAFAEAATGPETPPASAISQALLSTPEYERDGQAARTLLRAPDLRVVLVALREHKTLHEHHAKATATVQLLSGRVRMQLLEQDLQLVAGQLLTLAAGAPHDVRAESDARLLLTLAW